MITRRTFLNNLTLAAAGSSLLPSVGLRASEKSGSRIPVLGSGAHQFECLHDWIVPPQGMVWGDTHAVCQDAEGFIYVAHTVHKSSMRGEAVVVYDSSGKFVRAFGEEFRGGAHGMDLRVEAGTQLLYHCDTNRSKTVITTLGGKIVHEHGYPIEDPLYGNAPKNYIPTNTAFAPNGDYFVADGYGSNHVLWYNREGRFLGEIGHVSDGPAGVDRPDGELNNPHGLWVDDRSDPPVLVVADRGNQRIQVFSLDGRHLRTVKDPQHLRRPCHFHCQGDLMVCPDLDSQVCLLDKTYAVIAQLGDGQAANGKVGSRRSQTRAQFTPGQFICPHDALFLHSGDILVSEWLPIGRITLLRRVS